MEIIDLSIFSSRVAAVCDEMGATLRRTAFSPNIKDRLDFSCAVFNAQGELCAQAAHIPVHLGSMAFAMRDLATGREWQPGDMLIVNDPYLGGTHLPDITVIAPVFYRHALTAFVVNRAHHADIGSDTPGSMPISARLEDEGLIIPPTWLVRSGSVDDVVFASLVGSKQDAAEGAGDFHAQISANRIGVQRVVELAESLAPLDIESAFAALNDYGERLARASLRAIPNGAYSFSDVMDDDGQGHFDIRIEMQLTANAGDIHLDFTGTAPQVHGNINCPLSVTFAAAYYALRCLMPPDTPACWGTMRSITLHVPEGLLLNARRPAAVSAGNVETSTRVVDVVLGALAHAVPDRIPAASHGSMNNLAMGARGALAWDYYETIGGGMGAGLAGGGLSAIQTHMTNTLNTPIEVIEMRYPLRVTRYEVREGSGGRGARAGGNGIRREYQFMSPAVVSLLTERRRNSPWGIRGGAPGAVGRNLLNGKELASKITTRVVSGDILTVETPGGGGFGPAP